MSKCEQSKITSTGGNLQIFFFLSSIFLLTEHILGLDFSVLGRKVPEGTYLFKDFFGNE